MRKMFVFCLVLALMISITAGADGIVEKNIKIFFNAIRLALFDSEDNQIPSLIKNGRVYVPIDAFIASIGGDSYYDELNNTLTISLVTKSESAVPKNSLQTINEAENLIGRGRYAEADVLLASVPDSDRKSELLATIALLEVKDALENGNYLLAEKKLELVPAERITDDIQKEIKLQKAEYLLSQGLYQETDTL